MAVDTGSPRERRKGDTGVVERERGRATLARRRERRVAQLRDTALPHTRKYVLPSCISLLKCNTDTREHIWDRVMGIKSADAQLHPAARKERQEPPLPHTQATHSTAQCIVMCTHGYHGGGSAPLYLQICPPTLGIIDCWHSRL